MNNLSVQARVFLFLISFYVSFPAVAFDIDEEFFEIHLPTNQPINLASNSEPQEDEKEDEKQDGEKCQENSLTQPEENTSISSVGSSEDECIHIPEPLYFDLVRGLDSRKGDAEINVLSAFNTRKKSISLAPEVEIAIRDGTAIEFELPTDNFNVASCKFAFQQRLFHKKRSIGGLQSIYEVDKDFKQHEVFIVPILGVKLNNKFSILSISGFVGHLTERHTSLDLILNGSLFYESRNKTIFACEVNLQTPINKSANRPYGTELRVLPQIHRKIGENYGLQVGAGLEFGLGRMHPVIVMRIIREFHLAKPKQSQVKHYKT